MKMIWKLLGAAALAVGLTPYHVEKSDETGETKYQALLWQATKTPGEGEKGTLDINIGFKMPDSEEEEVHLFSDELCVEYTGTPVTEEPASEPPAEATEPAAPAEAAEPEAPAEAAEDTPADENEG